MSRLWWIGDMWNDVQYHGVYAGLEITVARRVLDMAFPRAVIGIDSTIDISDYGDNVEVAIFVRMSPNIIRALLQDVPVSGFLLSGCATKFAINDPILVRRIALEVLRSEYRETCLSLFLKGKVIELLVALLAKPEDGHGESDHAMAARDILLRTPLNPPSMGELARLVGVPQRRLSADFKRTFGHTLPEWLADWRLCRGREQIAAGDQPIAEIAAALGYAHLSTFTAAFAKKFGSPPTCFRSHKAST